MMKLYLAAPLTSADIGIRLKQYLDKNFPDIGILISYAYEKHLQSALEIGYKSKNIMLDSGAFTVEKRGKHLTVDAYIEFLKAHEGSYEVAISLDDISDPDLSIKNWEYMRQQGVNTIPVYHINRGISYLDYYADKCSYIGLGGVAINSSNFEKSTPKLDKVFDRYSDHKFHGLGINSFPLISRYPFHSIDSTSWLSPTRFGTLLTPWGNVKLGRGVSHNVNPVVIEWLKENGIEYPVDYEHSEFFSLSELNIRVIYEFIETCESNPKKKFALNNSLF